MNQSVALNLDNCFNQKDIVQQLKQLIIDNKSQLSKNFNPKQNVKQLLLDNSLFVDDILILCWKHFLLKHADNCSLIATGGYGRNELFPNSDIDILILLKDTDTSSFQDELSGFCNLLWDIGLMPGQSVRTIPECLQVAIDDQTIMTSLLETRLITGNAVLYKDLIKLIFQTPIWNSEQFFAAKMQEQEWRYIKYHDTAYNLEPNIKEGPGGLRDLQNITWIFKHHYKTSTLKELLKYKLLSEAEYKELIACRNILWSLRFALHLLTNRCENRLLFNYQRELATQFDFIDDNAQPDVEQFMQYYFRTVMELERLNEMLLQFFSEQFIISTQNKQLSLQNEHFISINGYLEIKEKNVFSKHPLALLEVFSLLQKHQSLKGIRASTIRSIRKNLHLIDDNFRNNTQANQLFLSIFQSSRGITHPLRQMNRYGVLATYLPCFANVVARMQYDLFHIYTVDAHTLFLIKNLRRFALDKHNHEFPFCNSVFLHIKKPEILYIAALFHDIAKGKNGDHSVLGEEISRQFCQQHKISKSNTKLITWLVRNHLIMSMTAQRKDICDPDIIHKFALQVGSIDYLNHLYLLTVADIRATNPSLWNSWKDQLLLDLYTYTHSVLHRGLQNPATKSKRLHDNKQEARDELIGLGISEATIQKTWNHIGGDYFLRYSADEIAWHTIAIASTSKKELPLVILRPQNQRGSVEIFIYTKNEKHIFSLSAETLDYLELTILDARVVTITLPSTEQYILNSFQVLEKSGKPILDLARELHIHKTLQYNLSHRTVKKQNNIHRQSRQAKHFPITSRIYFHTDPLGRYTIIELITTDQAGLLALIGQAFIDLEIQLHDAKITTIGSRVEDMFYVTNLQSKPITAENKLKNIKEKLISILNN